MSNKNEKNLSINNMETTQLVEKAIAGDKDAFGALIDKYTKFIFSVINGMTNVSNVEDIAQEVAIKAYNNIATLKSPYAFTSWLRVIAINVTRNYNDMEKRQKGMDVNIEESRELEETNIENLPEASLEKESSKVLLYKLINKLPEAQRASLYLYYHDELKYSEIGKLLGINPATVGTNIIRAKGNLKKMLEKDISSKEHLMTHLRSAAIGPAIAGAFDVGISGHLTEPALKAFSMRVTDIFSAATNYAPNQTVVGIAKTATGVAKGVKIAAVLASFTLVAGGATGYYVHKINDKPAPPENKPAAVVYKQVTYEAKDVRIVFKDAKNSDKNVDPISVSVYTGGGGTPKTWIVTNAENAVVATGVGGEFTVPGELLTGKYTITWEVASEDNAIAKVTRYFYISDPEKDPS